MHFPAIACCLVNLEVLRKSLTELEGDAPAHHADTIDYIDESFGLGKENVTVRDLYHCASH